MRDDATRETMLEGRRGVFENDFDANYILG
jgi:hypothetical protein